MDASLSQNVYSAEQVRQLEAQAAKQSGHTLYHLMELAGNSAFELALTLWPARTRWLVLVGKGNNGGDGYIMATQARKAGIEVQLGALDPEHSPTGDAANAQQAWLQAGGSIQPIETARFDDFDLIADALLGTGARPPLSPSMQALVASINQASAKVLSLDIPTGLDAGTGQPQPIAVQADHVITFIALKPGLITGQARAHAPHLTLDTLGVETTFTQLATPVAQWRNFNSLPALAARKATAHKGNNGRLLCIGGDVNMGGAIRLCAEAALRTGAGLVKVMCHPELKNGINRSRPECMLADSQKPAPEFEWADVIVIGPGLGTSHWGSTLFQQLMLYLQSQPKPLLIDADGLNLLATQNQAIALPLSPVLTPHPGEAARLLKTDIATVESNRWKALERIQQQYSPYCLLKGPGSIISTHFTPEPGNALTDLPLVCANGNSGMASGGMGDVLSGIVGGLLAQGFDQQTSLIHGTLLHSCAADLCAQNHGQRGMLASDLFPFIRQLVNK